MSVPLPAASQEPLFDVPAPPPGAVWEWVKGFGWVERPVTPELVAMIQAEDGAA